MSLSFWAAKSLIGSKKNFFTDSDVAPVLKDYICDVYERFNVCQNCPKACKSISPGKSINVVIFIKSTFERIPIYKKCYINMVYNNNTCNNNKNY